ncbi:MAG: hypothetical protein B0W54_13400 [Cellvibrio sp. 79]|nr:MAG: hypothetical protein B0W54_13400 [Cellvibrio sp. 79]
MYEFAKRFAGAMLAITAALYLTACGGAANEESTAPPANKPTSSATITSTSTEASSKPAEASSSIFSSSSSSQSSSLINAVSTSSSSSLVYQRASRSSSSADQNSSVNDTTAPSKVKLLTYKIGTTSLTFIWDHAVDDQGVDEYVLERDGQEIARLEYPTYIHEDKGLSPYTSYSYSLRALDYGGNLSEQSSPTVARTLRANTPNSSSEAAISSSSQSSSSSNEQASSSSSSSNSSNSSSSTSSTATNYSVHVKWQHPTQRANGAYLELQEIAGYEIRKKNNSTGDVIFIVVEGNAQTDFIMDDITADDVIDITVYDTNKLYSEFVRLYPQ